MVPEAWQENPCDLCGGGRVARGRSSATVSGAGQKASEYGEATDQFQYQGKPPLATPEETGGLAQP